MKIKKNIVNTVNTTLKWFPVNHAPFSFVDFCGNVKKNQRKKFNPVHHVAVWSSPLPHQVSNDATQWLICAL